MDETTRLEALCLMIASLCASETTIDLSIGEIAEIPEEEILYEQLVERRGTSYQINETLPYSGYALKYHDNGQVSLRAIFLDGKREGVWKYFHDNGELLKEESYPNAYDRMDAYDHIVVKTFDRSGNFNGYWPREDFYSSFEQDDYDNTTFINFFNQSGETLLSTHVSSVEDREFVNSYDHNFEFSGPSYESDENGISYVNWFRAGEWVGIDYYHANGELAIESRISYPGSIKYQNIYDDMGYPVNFGTLDIFYPTGEIFTSVNIRSGKLHGEYTEFWRGEGFTEGNYKNGLHDGELKGFDLNEELTYKAFFVNGLRDGRAFYYEDGKIVSEMLIDMDKFVIGIDFDTNGDIERCYDESYNTIDCEDF